MNILIVSASQRLGSNSEKMAQYCKTVISQTAADVQTEVIDLAAMPYLLLSYSSNLEEKEKKNIELEKNLLSEKLAWCDAFIISVPEWGGMMTPVLNNFFLLCSSGLALAHKPGFIIGISAGGGGIYPNAMIRGFSTKNTHILWIPQNVVIQNINTFLEKEWAPEAENRVSIVQSRLLMGIKSLLVYAAALKPKRETLLALSQKHPSGV